MIISKENIAKQLESMSNAKLLHIVEAGTFAPITVEAAIDELRSRGVDIPTESAVDKENTEQPQGVEPGVDLVTIYQTDNPFTAQVLRNLLESEGVFAYVWGQHLGIAHTFLSFASGGMRVQVRADQLAAAKEIVAQFERGEYRVEDDQNTSE